MLINKSNFIEALAAQLGVTMSEAERMVNTFFDLIYKFTGEGTKVNFSGFGQFTVSHRAQRTGVNPRHPTEQILIPEHNTPKFKAGEAFKAAVALKH